MPQHWPKNTLEITHYCRTCNRNTQHQVYNGRMGHCLSEHHVLTVKNKKPAAIQESLFSEQKGGGSTKPNIGDDSI